MSRDQDQANDVESVRLDVAELLEKAEHDVDYDTGESLTVSTSAVQLTANKYGNRDEAFITVEVGPVRFWPNDVPTASAGHILYVDDQLKLHSATDIQRIRFIRKDGNDATLRCSYGH